MYYIKSSCIVQKSNLFVISHTIPSFKALSCFGLCLSRALFLFSLKPQPYNLNDNNVTAITRCLQLIKPFGQRHDISFVIMKVNYINDVHTVILEAWNGGI